jgi:hypothetical protein
VPSSNIAANGKNEANDLHLPRSRLHLGAPSLQRSSHITWALYLSVPQKRSVARQPCMRSTVGWTALLKLTLGGRHITYPDDMFASIYRS